MVRFIEKDNMTALWEETYKTLIEQGEAAPSRVGKVKHLTNITLILTNPKQSVTYSPIRKLSPRYLAAEMFWYLAGRNDVEYIGSHAKMWNSLTDDGETVNSAYGYVMLKKFGFDQLDKAIKALKKDIHSRQAVIHFKTPTEKASKDVLCTVSTQFVFFNGKLNGHTYMRSNDIWFGTPYDVVFFTTLLQMVAQALGVPVGEYHHTVGDLHVYTKNIVSGQNYTVSAIDKPEFEYTEFLRESCRRFAQGDRDVFTPLALYRLEDLNENKD